VKSTNQVVRGALSGGWLWIVAALWLMGSAASCSDVHLERPGVPLMDLWVPEVLPPPDVMDWQEHDSPDDAEIEDVAPDVVVAGCASDRECGGARPYCDASLGVCVACRGDGDCEVGACDSFTRQCLRTPCVVAADCLAPVETCTNVAEPMQKGYCAPSCLPFSPRSLCAADQWCFPSVVQSGTGVCVPRRQGGQVGEPCQWSPLPQGTCGDGLSCPDDGSQATCRHLCDPYNAQCPGGVSCDMKPVETSEGTVLSAFGLCVRG